MSRPTGHLTRPATANAPSVSGPPPVASAGRRLAVVVLIVGVLMDLIDASIVNVALPTIRADLGATGTALEWVVSAYLLAFAATLVPAGRVGDRVGRKALFLAGVALFGLASLACGAAQDPTRLIVGRALQGIAAGTMTPQVLATIRAIFTGKERGAVIAVYGAVAGLAVAVGLLLGGVLTSANLAGLGWRTVFLVNVPIAIAVLIVGSLRIPETRNPGTPWPDLPGTALLVGGVVAIVYPLLEGQSLGWPPALWLVLAAGLLAIATLVWLESRGGRAGVALLPTTLFRTPAFAAGSGVQLLFSASLSGFSFILALWLQSGEGTSPFLAGLTAVAFSIGTIVFAPMSVGLAVKFGRWVLFVGGLLMAAGMLAILVAADVGGTPFNLWLVVPGLLVAGAGLALLVIPLTNVVMTAIPAASAGGASGVLSTAQQLGGAMGIALIGASFFSALPTVGFRGAFESAMTLVVAGYVACAVLALALPRTAVAEAYE